MTEKLRTFRIGGVASLDGTWRVNPAFALHGGVRVAAYYQRTQLSGNDCLDDSGATDGCDGFVRARIATSRSGLGADLGGSIGGTYSWGWGQVSLVGTVQYQINNPGVRNPTFTDPAPASVRYNNTFAFGATAMVTIPLN